MAYGKSNVRRRVSSGHVSSRRSLLKKGRTSKRKSVLQKARVSSVASRKRTIKSNSRAIRKLQRTALGPRQEQISAMGLNDDVIYVMDNQPLLFQVLNPSTGTHGPAAFCPPTTDAGTPVHSWNKFFELYNPTWTSGYADYHKLDSAHMANGPELWLDKVKFQFKFTGFMRDTRVRITLLRQKRMDSPFWTDNNSSNFLPFTLAGFRGLAGFGMEEIDRDCFQVISDKRVYVNSMGQKSAHDKVATAGLAGATTMDTSHADTAPTRYCQLTYHHRKEVKQIKSSVSEISMLDNGNAFSNTDAADPHHGGGYKYSNLHPLKNVWCLVSCDDVHDAADTAAGHDKLRVEIVRKCFWRDRVA